jgi:hypothetical protein
MCDITNAVGEMEYALRRFAAALLMLLIQIKSPDLIRSEGRPARSMRRRICVSHDPSQIQKGIPT